MKPHQQRVVDEKAELDAKISKLKEFFGTDLYVSLDRAEQRRLSHQHAVMTMYSGVLGMRIAVFNSPETEGVSQETKLDAPSKIDSDLEDAVSDQLISSDYAEELSAARDELAKRIAHMKSATADDSLAGSCNCLTKTPEFRFHKKGCKYRLICERNELVRQVAVHDEDLRLAAGELLVPMPKPGSNAARMIRANQLMRRERDTLMLQRVEMRQQLEAFHTKLSSVMPEDFKDWHQNSKSEWPEVAAFVITSQRERICELGEELEDHDRLRQHVTAMKEALQDIADMLEIDQDDFYRLRYKAQQALHQLFPESARPAPYRPPAPAATPDPDPRPAASITRSKPGDGPTTSDTTTSS